MDIHTFKRVVKYLEPSKTSDGKVMRPPAIMITGRHGIGKSGVMRQIAKEVCGLPLIDRRIGQMCEGDLVGLQKIDGEFTKFLPVEFIHRAAREPHFLFFDEANRGTKEVMQVMFQLVLDYELNGVVLHPDTRIAIAVNEGSQYTVTQMDPALRDRFFYVELEPTVDEWLEWASAEGLNNAIISFNRQRPSNLDTPADTRVSGRTQSRRSWHMLSAPLDRLMKQDGFAVERDECLYELFSLASGFVGDALAEEIGHAVDEHAARLAPPERRRQRLGHRPLPLEGGGQRDGILHRQLGARADGEVRRVHRVTHQHHVVGAVEVPPLVALHALEAQPRAAAQRLVLRRNSHSFDDGE